MYTVNFEKHELDYLLSVLEDKIEKLQWEYTLTKTKTKTIEQELMFCIAHQGKLIRHLNSC